MRYTVLKVTDAGVVLFDAHRERLGAAWGDAFDAFSREAEPGIYALRVEGDALRVTRREGSRLMNGMSVRFATSPIAGSVGARAKAPPPSPWDAVRTPGVAQLLTSSDGREIFEACSAAVLAWDGGVLVATPEPSPRSASITESYLLARHPHRREPLLVDAAPPLVLVNAVVGVCVPHVVGRRRFPREVVEALRATLEGSARRAPSGSPSAR